MATVKTMAALAQNINPSILTWARETAGLSADEAAKKIGLSSSQKASAAEKLEAFEEGETKPTRRQLLGLAKAYRRPLTVFYLNEPPRKANRGEDFRTLPREVSSRENALLDALLRDVHARQGLTKSVLEDDEDVEHLEFVGSLQVGENVETAALRIKAKLRIDSDNWTREHKKPDELFEYLRSKAEDLGVFVLLIGDPGSHHSDISEEIFRGFLVADDLAPFIVINDQDARTARTFTLAHELVHLFLGTTGVSAPPATEPPRTKNDRVERFCNDVASEMLLPTESLKDTPIITSMEHAKDIVSELAEDRNLSEPMITYRLQRMGRINRSFCSELYKFYAERWRDQKQRNRKQVKKTDGGPNYYVVRRYCLGDALLNLVGRTLRENQLTHTTAARIFGVKPGSVEPLLSGVKGINGSHRSKARV